MLEIIDVSKRFGKTQALQQIHLQVSAGETVALLGTSGCGKSTLLRLIIGLLTPDTGEIRWQQESLQPADMLPWRRRVGYVIQEGGLFPHLTLWQNVTLMAQQLQWSRENIQSRVQALAALTHLPVELLQRYPTQVSGGQRQRVALMRALFLDPEVLLLDEPLGALDPIIRSELQQELKSIVQTLQKTVVLVTHDLHEAAYLADRIAVMQGGKVLQFDTSEALSSAPADPFVEKFLQAQQWIPSSASAASQEHGS